MGKAEVSKNSPFLKKLCVFSTIKMDVLKYNLDYPDSLLIRLILMRTEIPCCRWSEGPSHPKEASSPPPPQSALAPIRQMDPCQSFAQIKNDTCFAPDSWEKSQMESVGTGRPSASCSCTMSKEKLGSIRKSALAPI